MTQLKDAHWIAGLCFGVVLHASTDLRNRYGGEFGQRCLLSRRLIERGVRFIEVSHNLNFLNGIGWDVHTTRTCMTATATFLSRTWASRLRSCLLDD